MINVPKILCLLTPSMSQISRCYTPFHHFIHLLYLVFIHSLPFILPYQTQDQTQTKSFELTKRTYRDRPKQSSTISNNKNCITSGKQGRHIFSHGSQPPYCTSTNQKIPHLSIKIKIGNSSTQLQK